MIRRARWLLVLTPRGLGLLLALFLSSGLAANPVLFLKADLGTLCLILGGLISLLLGLGLLVLQLISAQQRRRVARARSEAVADKHRFLQRLDHELKNPLTAIRIGLANLDTGQGNSQPSETPAPSTLGSVKAQVSRISRLTADLRKLSELETRPIEQASVNLSSLLQQAVDRPQGPPWARRRPVI